MKQLFFFALSLTFSFSIHAQECDCPPGVGDDAQTLKTYHFSNGKQLGVCGYNTVEEGEDVTYTRFALFRCGDDKPIEKWGANVTCKIEQLKDELFIKEMYNLPVGQSFSTLWRPMFIHKFTFDGAKVVEAEYIDKKLPKYTAAQIAAVIKQYKELPQTANEETMKVANMLFWAAVSGSKEAEGYFKTIPDKFGPFDAVLAKEWEDISAAYETWKNKKTPTP